jgi:hypothetical protein
MATATKTRTTRAQTGSKRTASKRTANERTANERILESSRRAGNVYVDIYEKTLNSVADYQEKIGEQSQIDWVTTVANAQADFTRQVTRAYTSAARSVLK